MQTFTITDAPLTFEILRKLLHQPHQLELSGESLEQIRHCREFLDRKLETQKEPIYGITTGFGSLCDISISEKELTRLQENLVKSHACGAGNKVNSMIVRLMLLFKIHALSKGFSGIHEDTVHRLIDFYNNGVLPVIYEQGSLGASGDLAPLAHMSLPLLGLGEVEHEGKVYPTAKIARKFGWKALKLHSKEGLALLNGTQFMSAHAAYILLRAKKLSRHSDLIGAISLEAYNGRIDPFTEKLHVIRPHSGQQETALHFRNLLKGSQLVNSTDKRVQDPYSFRCIPQVHGAVKDTIRYVESVTITEINSVTDNPTVFPDDNLVVSGGNFHGEPIAFALDFLSIALAELGSISERRVYRLISGQRGLPEFLVAKPGLNSGFMIPQYTAASIVSQNKQLATPASVDSIPSSNEQEDHVSMGANAATKALRIVNNLETVLAIELMTAAQALEFRGVGLTSPFINTFIGNYRNRVPFISDDKIMYTEIAETAAFLRESDLAYE